MTYPAWLINLCLWLISRWWACAILFGIAVTDVPGSSGFWFTWHVILATVWAFFLSTAWMDRWSD